MIFFGGFLFVKVLPIKELCVNLQAITNERLTSADVNTLIYKKIDI